MEDFADVKERKKHSIVRTYSLLSFLSQVFGYGFYFVTSFVLVRLVGKHEFGVFQKFNLLVTTALPFFGLTLVSSLYYFHSIYETRKQKSRLFNQTFILLTVLGLIFFIFIYAFQTRILDFLNLSELNALSPFVFLTVLFFLNSSICDNIFLLDKSKVGVLLFLPTEKLILLVLLLASLFFGNDFYDLFYGFLIFSIFKFSFTFFYLIKYHRLFDYRPDLIPIIKQIQYCLPFYLGNVIFIISNKFDKFFLNDFISPSEFAIYSVAFLSIPFLSNAYNSINNVVLPEFSRLLKEGNKKEVRKIYRNFVIKSASISIPIIYFFFFFSPVLIELIFTKAYLEADVYYKIGLISFGVTLTSYGLILRASNETKFILYINAFSGFISIIIGIIIIPKYLLLGAITTYVVSLILPGFFQLIFEIRMIGYSFFDFFPIKNFISIVLIGGIFIPIFLGGKYFIHDSYILLIFCGLIYFPLVLYIFFKFEFLPFGDVLNNIPK